MTLVEAGTARTIRTAGTARTAFVSSSSNKNIAFYVIAFCCDVIASCCDVRGFVAEIAFKIYYFYNVG